MIQFSIPFPKWSNRKSQMVHSKSTSCTFLKIVKSKICYNCKTLFQTCLDIFHNVFTNLCQLTVSDRNLGNGLIQQHTTNLLNDGKEESTHSCDARCNCHIFCAFSNQMPTHFLMPIGNHSHNFHSGRMSVTDRIPTPFSTYYTWIDIKIQTLCLSWKRNRVKTLSKYFTFSIELLYYSPFLLKKLHPV